MDDLVEWLRAQLDEDELAARKAAELCGCHPPAPSWSFRDGDEPTDGRILVVDDPHPGLKRKIGRRWNGSYEGLFMAEHIVRHDPERVLREVEGTRRLIRAHEKWCEGRCEAKYPEGGFDAAHYWNLKVRAEASYSDRPGYRDEWRPL